jgi:hypothetical protein
MTKNSEIAIEKIEEGDIYYFKLNGKYFFLQILKVVTGLPEPYDVDFKFGYYIAVFQKTFRNIPKIEDLDLSTVYINKHYRKNTVCYFSIWNKKPHIQFDKNLMDYELKDKYQLLKFDNRMVKNFDNFKPPLVPQFSMPAQCEFHNGLQNTHQPMSIQAILKGLEEEEKARNSKVEKIKPSYFKEWLDYVNGDALLKTENAIVKYEEKEGRSKTLENALRKCIETINKVDEKFSHIGTIERENLVEKLIEISIAKELDEELVETIIEENRDW